MHIARVRHEGPDGAQARVVVSATAQPGTWVDVRTGERLRLERAGATARAARRIAEALGPGRLTAALEGPTDAMMWSIGEPVAWASAGETVAAGTLLGSGTVGGGCGLELGRSPTAGDDIELEIERLGVLRNRIGVRRQSGRTPPRRERREARARAGAPTG